MISYEAAIAYLKQDKKLLKKFNGFCEHRRFKGGLSNKTAVVTYVTKIVDGLVENNAIRKAKLAEIPYQQRSYLQAQNSKNISVLPGHYGANQ